MLFFELTRLRFVCCRFPATLLAGDKQPSYCWTTASKSKVGTTELSNLEDLLTKSLILRLNLMGGSSSLCDSSLDVFDCLCSQLPPSCTMLDVLDQVWSPSSCTDCRSGHLEVRDDLFSMCCMINFYMLFSNLTSTLPIDVTSMSSSFSVGLTGENK